MAQALIPLNIVIADRTYRIKTLPSDEETIRKTVKLINDKIIEFKTQFAGKDMQDYVSMVVIWYATQLTGKSVNPADTEAISTELARLEAHLDKALQ